MGYYWKLKVSRCGSDYDIAKSTFKSNISLYFPKELVRSFTVGSSKKSDIHIGGISPNHLTLQLGKDQLLINTEDKIDLETKEEKISLAKGEKLKINLTPNNFVQKITFPNGAFVQSRLSKNSEKLPPKLHNFLVAKHGTINKLQEGSTSLIFITEDNQILKVLRPTYATNTDVVKRFLRAAEKFQKIQSPLFNNVKEIIQQHDHLLYYVVMDYFPSDTLENYLSRRGILDEVPAKKIARNISTALIALEEQRYSCRNLSPTNILISPDKKIRISGFFLIKSMDIAATAPGARMVIPGYTSPEQIKNPTDADVMADVFSLGAIYYRMFIGEPPITANNTHEYELKLRSSNGFSRRDIQKTSSSIPLKTVDLIARLLSFDKEDRPTPKQIEKLLIPQSKTDQQKKVDSEKQTQAKNQTVPHQETAKQAKTNSQIPHRETEKQADIEKNIDKTSSFNNLRSMETILLRTYLALLCILGIFFTFTPTELEKKIVIRANEQSTFGSMQFLSTAQIQFQAGVSVDQNQDGSGEYGTLNELTGSIPLRGNDFPARPAYLSKNYAIDQTLSDGLGVAIHNGYMYRIYLPGVVSDQGKEKSVSPLNSLNQAKAINQQEEQFLVYAWPEEFGKTGRKTFVTQGNTIKVYKNEDGLFSGDSCPPYDAALTKDSSKTSWEIAKNEEESQYGIVFSNYSISQMFRKAKDSEDKTPSNTIDLVHQIFRGLYWLGHLVPSIINDTTTSPVFGYLLIIFGMFLLIATVYSAMLYSLLGRSPIYALVPVGGIQVLAKETGDSYPWLTAIVFYLPVFLVGAPSTFTLILKLASLIFWIRLNYFLANHFQRGYFWTVLLCLFPLLAQASLYLRVAKERASLSNENNKKHKEQREKPSRKRQRASRSPRARLANRRRLKQKREE